MIRPNESFNLHLIAFHAFDLFHQTRLHSKFLSIAKKNEEWIQTTSIHWFQALLRRIKNVRKKERI